jgi:hypothetical protein
LLKERRVKIHVILIDRMDARYSMIIAEKQRAAGFDQSLNAMIDSRESGKSDPRDTLQRLNLSEEADHGSFRHLILC